MKRAGCAAVVVAAGSSSRMGVDKLMLPLAGEPLLLHTVRAFEQCPEISSVVVITSVARRAVLLEHVGGFTKRPGFADGGATRAESVLRGLRAIGPADWVAVHDGARPLVTPAAISRVCHAAVESSIGAVLAEPVTDTLQRADSNGHVAGAVDRSRLWRMQTPQVFRPNDLRSALEAAISRDEDITDESSLMLEAGFPARIVRSPDWNPKVTYPRDLALAELMLSMRRSQSWPA